MKAAPFLFAIIIDKIYCKIHLDYYIELEYTNR